MVFKPVLSQESSRRITNRTITRPQTQQKGINKESKGDSQEIENFQLNKNLEGTSSNAGSKEVVEENIEEQFSQPEEVAHVSDTNDEVSQKDQGNQNQKVLDFKTLGFKVEEV